MEISPRGAPGAAVLDYLGRYGDAAIGLDPMGLDPAALEPDAAADADSTPGGKHHER